VTPDPTGTEPPTPWAPVADSDSVSVSAEVLGILDAALFDDEPGTNDIPATTAAQSPPAPAPAPVTRYPDVHAFVRDHLARVWSRMVRDPDNTFRWCPRWAEHPAAHDRLTALWQAWEALQAEGGTGPSRWWVEHADPTLVALTDPRGQFAQCGPDRHQLPPDLPLVSSPADLGKRAA
jgi:hypothetical protein